MQRVGTGTCASRHRITFRIRPDVPVSLFRSAGPQTKTMSLLLASRSGDVSHWIHVTSHYDEKVVAALDPVAEAWVPPRDCQFRQDVVSLSAVKHARNSWETSPPHTHMDAFLDDFGRERRQVLPHVGRERAWQISVQAVPEIFRHLHACGAHYIRSVPGQGFVHSHFGSTAKLTHDRRYLDEVANLAVTTIDLAEIGSVWVTRMEWLHHVELYDRAGRAMLILSLDPFGDHRTWGGFLQSLGDAEGNGVL